MALATPPYYVVGEKDSIRTPKLNADHNRILALQAGNFGLDLDGGDASTVFVGGVDCDGGGA